MRKLVILFLLMVMSAWSLAAENTILRKSYELDLNAQHVRTADDCEIVFWEVSQGLDTDIWAQKLSPTGQVMWTEPMPIVVKPGKQSILSVVRTSDNNFIVMWKEMRSSYVGFAWIQKISSTGERFWPEEGIRITDFDLTLDNSYVFVVNGVSMVANDVGGAFVFYVNPSLHYTATGQNFDQWGNKLWQPGGASIYTSNESLYGTINAVSDGSGGAIVNYMVNSGSKLLHVSASGSLIGTNPMLDASAFPESLFNIVSGVNSEIILYSHDYPTGNPFYMQKMNTNGDLLLPNAVEMGFTTPDADFLRLQVVPINDGGVYVLMSNRYQSYSDLLKIQRYDNTLMPMWDAGGTVVVEYEYPAVGLSANLNVNNNGDSWVTWIRGTTDGSYHIYHNEVMVQQFNAGGEAQLPTGGNHLNIQDRTAKTPIVLPYADHAMFVWQDHQDTTQVLRRQVISTDGELSLAFGGEPFVDTIAGQACLTQTVAMNDRYFCAWMDNRSGSNQVYYQITDVDLNPLLEPNGRALNLGVDTWHDKFVAMPDNSVAVLYETYNQGIYSLYLQKIDADGNMVYPGEGMLISSSSLWLSEGKMDYYAGDIYVSWIENNSSTVYVKAQRVSNGQSMWGTSGVTIAQNPYVSNATLYLKVSGRFFVWIHNVSGIDQCKVMTILLNPDGTIAPGWSTDGLSLLGDEYTQSQQLIDCGLVGDDLVALIKTYDGNVYTHVAQKINVSGQRLWQDGGYICLPSVSESDYINVQSCIFDDEITILLVADQNLYMQQINAEGDLLYPEYGVLVSTAISYYLSYCKIIKYDNGSMTIIWVSEYHTHMHYWYTISMQHVDPSGQLVGDAPVYAYEDVCYTMFISAASIGNSSIVTWNDDYWYPPEDDKQFPNSIKACRIVSSPVGIEDEINIASPMPRLRQNYPNPFNPVTTIAFDLSTAQPASLRVYNIKGQLVKTLLNDSPLTTGTHSITWDGRDEQGNAAAGGIYFYRLTTPDQHLTKKMVMLK